MNNTETLFLVKPVLEDPQKFPADFPTSVKPGLVLDFH